MTRLLALALLAAACTPNFQSQSQVVDLRILAVSAEPPEAQFDADAGTVQDVRLTVLAVDPARADSFAVLDAQVCEPTDSRLCDQGLSIDEGRQTRQGGDFFASTLSVPPAVLAEAVAADKLGAFDGIRVQYSFSVDDGDPAGPQTGDKIIIYSPVGGTPNHNPQMTGIEVSENGALLTTLMPGDTLSAPENVELGLRPVLAADARETYTTTDLLGNPVQLTEDPTYSFYTTPGAQFDENTADEPVDGVAPPDGLARFETLHSGSGTFWIVVRDGRGGETWLAIPWTAP